MVTKLTAQEFNKSADYNVIFDHLTRFFIADEKQETLTKLKKSNAFMYLQPIWNDTSISQVDKFAMLYAMVCYEPKSLFALSLQRHLLTANKYFSKPSNFKNCLALYLQTKHPLAGQDDIIQSAYNAQTKASRIHWDLSVFYNNVWNQHKILVICTLGLVYLFAPLYLIPKSASQWKQQQKNWLTQISVAAKSQANRQQMIDSSKPFQAIAAAASETNQTLASVTSVHSVEALQSELSDEKPKVTEDAHSPAMKLVRKIRDNSDAPGAAVSQLNSPLQLREFAFALTDASVLSLPDCARFACHVLKACYDSENHWKLYCILPSLRVDELLERNSADDSSMKDGLDNDVLAILKNWQQVQEKRAKIDFSASEVNPDLPYLSQQEWPLCFHWFYCPDTYYVLNQLYDENTMLAVDALRGAKTLDVDENDRVSQQPDEKRQKVETTREKWLFYSYLDEKSSEELVNWYRNIPTLQAPLLQYSVHREKPLALLDLPEKLATFHRNMLHHDISFQIPTPKSRHARRLQLDSTEILYAHKVVLKRIPYFEEYLRKNRIVLPEGTRMQWFKDLLAFAYTGVVKPDQIANILNLDASALNQPLNIDELDAFLQKVDKASLVDPDAEHNQYAHERRLTKRKKRSGDRGTKAAVEKSVVEGEGGVTDLSINPNPNAIL